MYSIFKATVGHKSEIKNRARRMSWADDGDSCEDFITTSCRVQTPQYVTADEFAALTDQVKTLITVGKLQLQFENFQYTYEEHQQTRETTQLPLLLERMQNHYQVLPSPTCSQSPSPNCGVDSLCFKYGEPGYLRRDCVKSTAAHNHSDKEPDQQLRSEGTEIQITNCRGYKLAAPKTRVTGYRFLSL